MPRCYGALLRRYEVGSCWPHTGHCRRWHRMVLWLLAGPQTQSGTSLGYDPCERRLDMWRLGLHHRSRRSWNRQKAALLHHLIGTHHRRTDDLSYAVVGKDDCTAIHRRPYHPE